MVARLIDAGISIRTNCAECSFVYLFFSFIILDFLLVSSILNHVECFCLTDVLLAVIRVFSGQFMFVMPRYVQLVDI